MKIGTSHVKVFTEGWERVRGVRFRAGHGTGCPDLIIGDGIGCLVRCRKDHHLVIDWDLRWSNAGYTARFGQTRIYSNISKKKLS